METWILGVWLSVLVSAVLGFGAVALSVVALREMNRAERDAVKRYEILMSAIGEAVAGLDGDDVEEAREELVRAVAGAVVEELRHRQQSAGATSPLLSSLFGGLPIGDLAGLSGGGGGTSAAPPASRGGAPPPPTT